MKSLTVRLPESLVAQIEAEARERKISKSDIVRERLEKPSNDSDGSVLDAIADLAGSVKGLPPDLSSRTKYYLRVTGYGQKRPRRHKLSGRLAS
jgi:hypothetical protein